MNGDTGIGSVLDVPLVGKGIATNNNLEPGISQDKTYRSVTALQQPDS